MFQLVVADKPQVEDAFRFYAGRLLLGSDLELLRCSADLWSPEQYRNQWAAAAKRLIATSVTQSAFVTSVARGRNNMVWWVARRNGSTVVLRNHLLFLAGNNCRVPPHRAHLSTKPDLMKHGPSATTASEWRVSVKELSRWLRHPQ